jgi:hypothetical protein
MYPSGFPSMHDDLLFRRSDSLLAADEKLASVDLDRQSMILPGAARYLATSATSLRRPNNSPSIQPLHITWSLSRPQPATVSAMSYHTTTLSMQSPVQLFAATAIAHPAKTIGSIVGILGLIAYWQYQDAIRRRLKQLKEESWIFGAGVTMARLPTSDARRSSALTATARVPDDGSLFPALRLLELNPDFVQSQSTD